MSNHKIMADLSQKSSTFPELALDPLIPLDSKIGEIKRKFSPQNQIIILEGSSGSGKTVHLAEFVKANPYTSFSYFITDNYWHRRQTSFLSSLCQQMSVAVGNKAENALSIDNLSLDAERLKFIFETLVNKVIEVAKKTNTIFYFVIDGLERAFEGKPANLEQIKKIKESTDRATQLKQQIKDLLSILKTWKEYTNILALTSAQIIKNRSAANS